MNLGFIEKRIALHFALILSLLVTLATTMTQGYRFYENYVHLKSDLQSQIQDLTRFSALTLGPALWNLDKNYAEATATTALMDQNLLSFSVDADQNEFISKTQASEAGKAYVTGKLHPQDFQEVKSDIYFQEKKIGELHLVYSLKQYHDEILRSFWMTLVHEVGMIALLITLVYFFAQRKILTPIKKIRLFSSQIARGEFTHSLHLRLPNEIGDLAHNLELMRDSIQSSFHKLEEANSTLEEKVDLRTAELQSINSKLQNELELRVQLNRDLASAREKAESAAHAKARFLANMSHELRTPLTGIIGFSELMIEDFESQSLNPQYLEDLQRIRSAGKHLLNMINDILDFSKIEAGKIEIYPEKFNLVELIDETCGILKPNFQSKKNTFSVDTHYAPLELTQDSKKLRQSLLNLLSNANKFTASGSISLRIYSEIQHGASWTHFEIKDTGIGMTPEQLGKLFNSFQQGDASISHKFGGTGLGLTISKSFIELMGGIISVTSESGKGSCFTIHIPTHLPKTGNP
jgi:signal transduction histidine kinase